ncbi:J domain-containing protein [Acaryochloris marina]|uniref:J domain-containing protein n=1 Tax=Acaryochloris marina TaxID=155978 RepID=UPI001BAF4D9D|nr:J domain-containing protein [Acaryochloris marina]QUY40640.1 J domain-containing protein [Acaryochloris marina S15]
MPIDPNFYQLLDLSPEASSDEIHDAYRKKSKVYHPDTTTLPKEVAIQKFQQLNDAYGILSNPKLRKAYDYRLGVSSVKYTPVQKVPHSDTPLASSQVQIQERPLSPGELVALLILCITFLGCLILAVVLGFARGEMMFVEPTALTDVSSKFV